MQKKRRVEEDVRGPFRVWRVLEGRQVVYTTSAPKHLYLSCLSAGEDAQAFAEYRDPRKFCI